LLFEYLKAKWLPIAFSLLCSPLFSQENALDNNCLEAPASLPQDNEICLEQVELPSKQVSLFVDGEFLYWKPDQVGMTYCLLEETDTFAFILAPTNELRRQESNWGFGFRIGAGVDIEQVHADIAGYWTRFHHGMNSATRTNDLIFGTQVFFGDSISLGGGALVGIVGTPGGAAFSQWQLHLDLAELDFGYWITFSKWFSLHPYLGVEGGWIDQKQIIRYDHFFDTGAAVFFDAVITQKNRFQGVGPLLGFDGTFHMGYGLGLMGKLAGCFLYGSSQNPVFLEVTGTPFFAASSSNLSVSYKQHRLMPNLRAQVGLTWEGKPTERFTLGLNALYEVQCFWEAWRNQSSFIQNLAVSDASYANLMLQGFTGQVQVSF